MADYDPYLPLFDLEKAARFREAVRNAAGALGFEITMYTNYFEKSDGSQFGLENLMRVCKTLPDKDWKEHIDLHLNRIFDAQQMPQEEMFELDDFLDRIYARYVVPDAYDAELATFEYGISDQPNPYLTKVVAVDFEKTVALLPDRAMEKQERFTTDFLLEHATNNLRDALFETEVRADPVNGNEELIHLSSASMYMSSMLLAWPSLALDLWLPFFNRRSGILFGYHSRSSAMVISGETVYRDPTLFKGFQQINSTAYEEFPGPLIDSVEHLTAGFDGKQSWEVRRLVGWDHLEETLVWGPIHKKLS